MAKMRVPMPRIQPSVRASMAEETTPLAKPVMGTSVPAPACLPSLAYQPDGDPRRGVFLFHAAVFRENMDACLADGADQSADQKRQGNVFPGLRPGCGLILHGFVKFTTDFHMQPSFAEKYVQFSGNYTGMFHVKHFETDCCFTEKAYRRGEHGLPENLRLLRQACGLPPPL